MKKIDRADYSELNMRKRPLDRENAVGTLANIDIPCVLLTGEPTDSLHIATVSYRDRSAARRD